jgi:hypothetical protein
VPFAKGSTFGEPTGALWSAASFATPSERSDADVIA